MRDSGERPRLMRIRPRSVLGGICAGFAYWLAVPTWIVRAATVGLVIFAGTGVIAYLILWALMPALDELPADYNERTD